VDIGFIQISDEGGDVRVVGEVFDQGLRRIFNFEQKTVLSEANIMFFDYKTSSLRPDFAYCVYRFFRKRGSKLDYVAGEIIDTKAGRVRQVYGTPTKQGSIYDVNLEEKVSLLKSIDEIDMPELTKQIDFLAKSSRSLPEPLG
jgi:hypothetical protein